MSVPVAPLSQQLSDFLSRPGIEKIVEDWRERKVIPGELNCIMDGLASGHDSGEAIPGCIGMIEQTRDSSSHKKRQKKDKVVSTTPGPLENAHPLQSKNYPQVLSINISLYERYTNPLFVPFEDPYCDKVSNNTIHHT